MYFVFAFTIINILISICLMAINPQEAHMLSSLPQAHFGSVRSGNGSSHRNKSG